MDIILEPFQYHPFKHEARNVKQYFLPRNGHFIAWCPAVRKKFILNILDVVYLIREEITLCGLYIILFTPKRMYTVLFRFCLVISK